MGRERPPTRFDHVFASIQSLNAAGVSSISPDHFDVVIVDEFHHAAAQSYMALLERVTPQELLGLTALRSGPMDWTCFTTSMAASRPNFGCGM